MMKDVDPWIELVRDYLRDRDEVELVQLISYLPGKVRINIHHAQKILRHLGWVQRHYKTAGGVATVWRRGESADLVPEQATEQALLPEHIAERIASGIDRVAAELSAPGDVHLYVVAIAIEKGGEGAMIHSAGDGGVSNAHVQGVIGRNLFELGDFVFQHLSKAGVSGEIIKKLRGGWEKP